MKTGKIVENDTMLSDPILYFSDEKKNDGPSFGSKFKKFVKKYFLEGQKLSHDNQEKSPLGSSSSSTDSVFFFGPLFASHKKSLGILIPFLFFQGTWWPLAFKYDFFSLFPSRYPLALTMIFGSTLGGMTSEGGGAVAFPVMTLALGISSSIARDFSLLIQSTGMTSAAFALIFMGISLEWNAIVYGSLGSTLGIIFGLEVVDEHLSDNVKKLSFVSIWFSFAVSLYALNRRGKRKTFDRIMNPSIPNILSLFLVGFVGGIFSGIAGSGVDITSFSLLTLYYRLSEKVATPSSVVLMAINTLIGSLWKGLFSPTTLETESLKYLCVCLPFAVLFSPLGSLLSSYFHRQVLAALLYILDTGALITALIVIPMNWEYILLSASLIIGSFTVFYSLSLAGQRRLTRQEDTSRDVSNKFFPFSLENQDKDLP